MENDSPLGISYPLGYQNKASFVYTHDTISNERAKLINFLRTVEYERVMNPLFGLGLEKYIFEQNTVELRMRIEDQIRKKIAAWLPKITINNLEINISSNYDRNSIEVIINFGIKNIPEYEETISLRY